MPKKLSESQKKEMIDGFVNGTSIDELSENFNFTKTTIIRNLKKVISEKIFKDLLKQNNKDGPKLTKKNNLKFKQDSKIQNSQATTDLYDSYGFDSSEYDSLIEIAPIDCEIDNSSQKDLSSISISEIDLPKIVYMIVDNKIELKTKPLGDYPDWQFLPENDLIRETIEIFFDIKIAKRFCSKEQKVIKVPNTNVFKIVAPILLSKGISRIVSPDKLIAL